MTKIPPKGVQLQLGDGADPTEVFTTVAQLIELGGVPLETETADATDHDDVNGLGAVWASHIETLKRVGDIPIRGNWDPALATHDETAGLVSKVMNPGPHNWKVIWPDTASTTLSFAASLSVTVGNAPIDGGPLPFEGTLTVSGEPTWS